MENKEEQKEKKKLDKNLNFRGVELKLLAELSGISYVTLRQRINGNLVNGKPAIFTEAQKTAIIAAFPLYIERVKEIQKFFENNY